MRIGSSVIVRRSVLCLLGAGLSFGLAPTCFGIGTSSYVQSGLIAHWDGIDNAGVGQHDDAATVWKDLKNGREFKLYSVTVNDNRMTFAGSKTSYGELNAADTAVTFLPVGSGEGGTIEIVLHADSTANAIPLQSTADSGIVISRYGTTSILGIPSNPKYPVFNWCWTTGTNTLSVTYVKKEPVALRVDAATIAKSETKDYWSSSGSVTIIGTRAAKNGYPFAGSIYAIRLYNRPLTEEETAANRKIDEVRFCGLSVDDELEVVTAPSGLAVTTTPAIGSVKDLSEGDEIACSAPADYVVTETGTRVLCTGWKLYDENKTVVSSGNTTSLTYTHPGAYRRLEWQFKVEYLVTFVNDGATSSKASQWVEKGASLSFSATTDSGFDWYDWAGLPSGDIRSLSQTVSVNGPLTLTARGVRSDIATDITGTVTYLAEFGDDANDGKSWSTAKRSLGLAAAALTDGDGLMVGAGTYTTTATVQLEKGATIRGMGMDKTIVTSADAKTQDTRGFHMNNANALLEDLCVTGYRRWTGGYDHVGIGLLIDSNGGTARRCRFTDNSANRLRGHGQGVAMYSGKIYGCLIDHNVTTSDAGGGGLYMLRTNSKVALPYAENCLIEGNVGGSYDGGGVWLAAGTLVNCTVAGNTSKSGKGGGLFVGTDKNHPARVYNCIIRDNVAPSDANPLAPNVKINGDASPSTCLFNCLYDTDAQFVDAANENYTPRPNSPAVDAGSDETVACEMTVDFDGKPRRVGAIDIGCYEFDTTVFSCGFDADKVELFKDETVTLAATVCGGSGSYAYAWTALEASGVALEADGETATASFTKPGRYGFRLTVTDGSASTSVTREAYVYVVDRSVALPLGGDIQAAIDAGIAGSELVLAEGTFVLQTQILVHKGMTIRGAGYDKTTLQLDPSIRAQKMGYNVNQTRVVYLNNPDAVLCGVKVTGGTLGGDRYQYGAGVWIGARGGTVTNCWITDNIGAEYYQMGGGVGITGAKGRLTHSIVSDNRVNYGSISATHGGGVALTAGLCDNCLIIRNTGGKGGGVYLKGDGKVKNCTVAENTSNHLGGGICWDNANAGTEKVVNCLFAANVAASDATRGSPEWAPEKIDAAAAQWKNITNAFSHCAFYNATTVGVGSVSIAYPFADAANGDFTLLPGNKATQNGLLYDGMPARDLAGTARDDKPDIGCYELDASAFTCSFEVSPSVAFADESVTLTPTVLNGPEKVDYRWTLTDAFGNETIYTDAKPVKTVGVAGWYTIRLVVSDHDNPSSTAEWTIADALHLAARKMYATSAGANPTMEYPFDTPAKAHTNLIELVGEFIDGQSVELDAGRHVVTNQLLIDKAVTVSGQGRDLTTIWADNANLPTSKRVARLNHPSAVLEKVTCANGYYVFHPDNPYNAWGFGVLLDSKGGTLRDARVTGCRATSYHICGAVGLSSAAAKMQRCIVQFCTNLTGTAYGAVAISAGRVENCLVRGNKSNGAAVYVPVSQRVDIRNCTVVDNVNADSGLAQSPGGLYAPGVAGTLLGVTSCLFANNTPGAAATGLTSEPEISLTYNNERVASDSALACKIFSNNFVRVAADLPPLGTDGRTGDPVFVDEAEGDYRVKAKSPCRNAGRRDSYWAKGDVDLIGQPRVFGSYVDIGCYECLLSPGLVILVR